MSCFTGVRHGWWLDEGGPLKKCKIVGRRSSKIVGCRSKDLRNSRIRYVSGPVIFLPKVTKVTSYPGIIQAKGPGPLFQSPGMGRTLGGVCSHIRAVAWDSHHLGHLDFGGC